ncbi:MAG: hypothetical protein LBB86_04650, partial [Oscillospiraceae bacterium]|nr:hypothetical protein [Oscillospiraceae bacterium]
MEKLRVWFTDFWPTFDPNNNPFLDALGKRYDVDVTQPPDVLFHSVFGREFMEYDCLRVFYTGECCTPDFNACDYAIGFDYIDFGDRYLRLPLYLFN